MRRSHRTRMPSADSPPRKLRSPSHSSGGFSSVIMPSIVSIVGSNPAQFQLACSKNARQTPPHLLSRISLTFLSLLVLARPVICSRTRKSMSVLCRTRGDEPHNRLFVKGAPEMLVKRCSKVRTIRESGEIQHGVVHLAVWLSRFAGAVGVAGLSPTHACAIFGACASVARLGVRGYQ